MAKVLVIFGSDSDKAVFNPLMENLAARKVSARLEICSAHRDPKKLAELLEKSKEKLAIAGAGLSAALPGFVASHSDKLVLGVPVNSNYSGLDSLLSIHQMPKGFSVLGVGIEAIGEAAEAAEKILKKKKKVVIVNSEPGGKVEERVEACRKKLGELNIEFGEQEDDSYTDKSAVYIDFIDVEKVQAVDPEGKLVIFVPVKENSDKKDAIKLSVLAGKGLWVGLGRGENAAICAAKILGK